MKISLIIPVYKKIDFLDMIFESIKIQTYNEFDIIITEDDESIEMKRFIEKKQDEIENKIIHLYQQDIGFRKNKALNNSLKTSEDGLLVFIDGDCMLHPKFMEEYVKAYNEGDCFIGRRQELGKKFTKMIIEKRKAKINLFELLMSDSVKKEYKEALYFYGLKRNTKNLSLLGSNYAVKRKYLLKINGFDEDYVGYGMEDCDLEWRLRMAGAKFVSMKGRAIQYHLWHPENKNELEEIEKNIKIYNAKKSAGDYFRKNGLKKLEG